MTKHVLLSTILAFSNQTFAKPEKRKTASLVERPPQFVLLAFDGSLNNDFWDESMEFADTVKTNEGKRKLRFTYFVNPVYYTSKANRHVYMTPGLNRAGVSCIGWTDHDEAIVPRIDRTNLAHKKGHEIGSHANAHCDQSGVDRNDPMYGHPWSSADWDSEFNQFNKLLFGSYKINGLQPSADFPNGWTIGPKDIVGFRAPKLAVTPGLWPTLGNHGFRYDTSKSSPPTYWPQKQTWGGKKGWNFPLGEIKIAGTSRRTFSMDYNWLCYHSACASKKGLTEQQRQMYKQQMLDSYKYYFKINYFGGRAPVHIGHHFSKWNKGAYWEAMQDFAKSVCNRKEVRCVTYREYADWLDGLAPATYEAYRSGQFQKMADDNTIQNIAAPVLSDIRLDIGNDAFEAVTSNAQKAEIMGFKTQLQVNFEPHSHSKITRDELQSKVPRDSTVMVRAVLLNKQNVEVNSETFRIDHFGTPEEAVSDKPMEDGAMMGETEAAHMMEE